MMKQEFMFMTPKVKQESSQRKSPSSPQIMSNVQPNQSDVIVAFMQKVTV
jgi:hypothetical protein